MLFDTHTHLDQEEFEGVREEALQRAADAQVREMILVGTTAEASRKCVELSDPAEGRYAAVGIQPNYVAEAAEEDWQAIENLATDPRVVAIGETGLDRYWDFAPFELQQDYFQRHISLAGKLNKPFIVHMRDCDEDILAALRFAAERGPLEGIMHSFTGSMEMALECIALGLYISFAGMVTFKKSHALREVVREVPPARLLIETDSPYLSPEPVRGKKPNEPAHLIHTAQCLADVRGISLEQLAALTRNNARMVFGLLQ